MIERFLIGLQRMLASVIGVLVLFALLIGLVTWARNDPAALQALVGKLASLQTDRISRALRELPLSGADAVRQFLRAMIDRDDPDKVLETIFGSGKTKAKE